MIYPTHNYYHPHLGHSVQVTSMQGDWVEFYNKGTAQLAWLESRIFEHAFNHTGPGPELTVDLPALRETAHQAGILVPWEFGTLKEH